MNHKLSDVRFDPSHPYPGVACTKPIGRQKAADTVLQPARLHLDGRMDGGAPATNAIPMEKPARS